MRETGGITQLGSRKLRKGAGSGEGRSGRACTVSQEHKKKHWPRGGTSSSGLGSGEKTMCDSHRDSF